MRMKEKEESPVACTSTAEINKDDSDDDGAVKHPFNSPKKEYYRSACFRVSF